MEELERFSLSNPNNFVMSGEQQLDIQQTYREEESVVAQSSICESDLEYTQLGNIRASTYKRTVEN
jgi:hypothetical protein